MCIQQIILCSALPSEPSWRRLALVEASVGNPGQRRRAGAIGGSAPWDGDAQELLGGGAQYVSDGSAQESGGGAWEFSGGGARGSPPTAVVHASPPTAAGHASPPTAHASPFLFSRGGLSCSPDGNVKGLPPIWAVISFH
ncbi:hypothetical protein GUJ93_ZPchr0006g42411 [Zizania palustris]|uniref:Uncharacterized protein n=1 Tax=Zizania palustris TaxID=103762 RepID=A0A8J5TCQ8_ZIZPA|nr:hypothetical protein GUJ93_ZPchr0006g42411 [Zizania palustris]